MFTKQLNDVNQNAIVLGYLGELYYLNKEYKKAESCFKKSLGVTDLKGMNVGGKVWCNIGLALLEQAYGNTKNVYSFTQGVQESITKLGIHYDKARPLMIEYRKLLRNYSILN